MNFPLRVVLALVVIGACAAVGVWGVIAVLQAKRLTESQRMIGVGGIVVVMALLAAWVIFLWPVYWD
jgi:hypothetical protein